MRERLGNAAICLGLLCATSGCAPAARLIANPNSVCAGRAVRLAWEGSAAGELTSEPVHPKTTTTYRFEVGSVLAKRAAATRVRVLEVPKDRIRVSAHVPADAWDSRLRVGAWLLETTLAPGEDCGSANPSALALSVSLICAD